MVVENVPESWRSRLIMRGEKMIFDTTNIQMTKLLEKLINDRIYNAEKLL